MKLYGVLESENAFKKKMIKQVEGERWAVIFPRVVGKASPRRWYTRKEERKGVSGWLSQERPEAKTWDWSVPLGCSRVPGDNGGEKRKE